MPQGDVVDPSTLPSHEDFLASADSVTKEWFTRLLDRFPVEVRFPEELPRLATARGERRPPRQRVWLRAAQSLPAQPLVHACAMTYISDLFLLATALPPHGISLDDPGVHAASLDHAVWFHAPARADDWLYYDMEGTWAGRARALCQGRFFDQQGTLLAHVVQEASVRSSAPRG
jgi:acyl-CoA thioesterase-2